MKLTTWFVEIAEGDLKMPKLGKKSKKNLDGVHPDLVRLVEEAIKHVDFSVLEGVRSFDRQQELVYTGKSKTMNSKHLVQSDGFGHALDIMAYPIDWNNNNRNYLFAGWLKGFAAAMGIKIRIGADWNGNFDTTDQSFHDLPHFEIVIE